MTTRIDESGKTQLSASFGIDARERAERRGFNLLTAEDEERLRVLEPHFRDRANEFIQRFYEHLTRFEGTTRFFQDPETLVRLKGLQRDYFVRLLAGRYDSEYFDDRLRVGHAHERIGLDPKWYLGAYNLYTQLVYPMIAELYRDTPERILPAILSLNKVIFLDIALAMHTYIAASMRSIEEQKRFTELILSSMSDAVVVIGADAKIQHVNQALLDLTGHEAPALLGQHVAVLWGEDPMASDVEQRLAYARAHGTIVDDNRSLISRSGERIPVSFRGTVMRTGEEVIGYVGVARDMREQRRLLQALEDAKANLERRVEERTAELKATQAELFLAEKLAAIGQLAAGIAHEIGTPLNIISGRAEYLLDDLPPADPRAEPLRVIVSQIDRITELVQNLLDFARRRRETRAPVSVADAAQSVLRLLEGRFRKDAISVGQDLAAAPPVRGDYNRLQQVFLNLLVNAADAIAARKDRKGGTITLRSHAQVERVILDVEDDGIGIPASNLPRIFEPFFTTKAPGEGTGLGLSVTYGIVREMGGEISARSRVGEGTTVTLSFPRF